MTDQSNGANEKLNLEISEYLKPLLKISIILTLIYALIVIVFGEDFVLWGTALALTGFIPLFIFLFIEYLIIKKFYKPLKVSQFFLIVIFSIIFYTLSFKTYTVITRTPIGVEIFFPLKTKKIKGHFIEKYDMEFKINEITYYLDMGSEASSGGWKKSISGYLISDPETPIKVWISEEEILDDYEKMLFKREVESYYYKLLNEIIPWEFKTYMVIDLHYKWTNNKSYEEFLKEKNPETIFKMSFSILISNEIFEKYDKTEYKDIYLEVVKKIYDKNYYLANVFIDFTLLDVGSEVIKKLSGRELSNRYKGEPYLLFVSTKNLDEDFFKVNNFEEFEVYMKKRERKEVERWIKN